MGAAKKMIVHYYEELSQKKINAINNNTTDTEDNNNENETDTESEIPPHILCDENTYNLSKEEVLFQPLEPIRVKVRSFYLLHSIFRFDSHLEYF